MDIIEHPVKYLIYIFIAMIFLLLLFKLNDLVDNRKIKPKEDKKKDKKQKEVVEVVEEKKEDVSTNSAVEDISFAEEFSDTSSNYLYDRFVLFPTIEDSISIDSQIGNAYITDDEYNSIRNSKVEIHVEDNQLSEREKLYQRIEAMTKENVETKEKLLKEFDGLSREMKLLLIENIIQKM